LKAALALAESKAAEVAVATKQEQEPEPAPELIAAVDTSAFEKEIDGLKTKLADSEVSALLPFTIFARVQHLSMARRRRSKLVKVHSMGVDRYTCALYDRPSGSSCTRWSGRLRKRTCR
jgi:hypothetical protein